LHVTRCRHFWFAVVYPIAIATLPNARRSPYGQTPASGGAAQVLSGNGDPGDCAQR
jgi:hypothetical protein